MVDCILLKRARFFLSLRQGVLETADLSACIRESDVILLAGLPEST